MILGLPWTSWLLLFLAVGIGFGISLTFYLAHRGEAGTKDHGADPPPDGTRNPGADPGSGADPSEGRATTRPPGSPPGPG